MKQKKVLFGCYYIANGAKYPKESLQGIFQKWGDRVVYEDEKAFTQTIAIILGDDGQVYIAPPQYVTIVKQF